MVFQCFSGRDLRKKASNCSRGMLRTKKKVFRMGMDISGLRVLVLGGGGFIGKRVVARLASWGATIRVLDLNKRENTGSLDDKCVEWITGSVFDETLVATAARGCDAAVFLASNSLPASANSDLSAEIAQHVRPSVRVAEICQAEGLNSFIFASSGGTVYGLDSTVPLNENSRTLPRNAYGASKLAIEHYLRILGSLRGIRTLSLRISNPYGPGQLAIRGQGFIAAAMQHAFSGEPMHIWGDGSVIRDFLYVDDLAEAIRRSVLYKGQSAAINIGSGVGFSLLEIVRKVEAATDRKICLTFDPSRVIDVASNVLDVSESQRELGWKPSTNLEEGLFLTANWWQSK